MLTTTTWGAGRAVVAVHGFTQTSALWAPLAAGLGAGYRVVAPDAPGHGGSAGVAVDLWGAADLLAETAAAAPPLGAGGPADWIGYSMGARLALHVALAHPGAVRRLVLLSATAGLDDPAERAARVDTDELVAQRVERDGVAAFVAWWLERPLFATLPPAAAAADLRVASNTVDGLASSLRRAGTGRQEPLWDRLGELAMPVLVVAGALDHAYVERAERLVAGIGANARLAVIPDAGHAAHLERPDAWLDLVRQFLEGSAGFAD